MNRKHYFDRKATTWDTEVSHNPDKLEIIINELELSPGNKVLDVASGTGVLIPYIHNKVSDKGIIVVNDISKKMISIAKKKYPKQKFSNLEFKVQDVMELPMFGQYEAIICFSCFPHFPHKLKLLTHLAKGLKTRGKLIIAHAESREKINMHHKKQKNTSISHDMLPPTDVIRVMMESANLTIEKVVDNEHMFYIIGIGS
ncbi:MAG: Demethylrebeccamycin-D-glucose O-methyltransferase [Promethearchaeota archaeon]|nr:MAG: Demethylrebeccamycin-D-glucose O-methyltransferase [Candidatus Lokiarchaeota archaeon]